LVEEVNIFLSNPLNRVSATSIAPIISIQ
jgi:hypothetical protein